MTSLLPAHLSELERDLDAAIARIGDVKIPIATLWNPWNCSIEVLPFLAWALSVDQWRSDWPETVKRRVVASSLDVHRIKGTRPAVERALSALGVTVELTEWFEADPPQPPGTFNMVAWANENITPEQSGVLNQTLYDQLVEAVNNAKNTRSHFTFQVGAQFGPSPVRVAGALSGLGALAHRSAPAVQPPLESQAGVAVAMVGKGVGVTRHTGELRIDASPRAARVLIGAACRGWAVIYRQMEATT